MQTNQSQPEVVIRNSEGDRADTMQYLLDDANRQYENTRARLVQMMKNAVDDLQSAIRDMEGDSERLPNGCGVMQSVNSIETLNGQCHAAFQMLCAMEHAAKRMGLHPSQR